ncbi:MAG: DUF1816 domain-containing protein [Hydrococcus sp. C42_A2020_068]|uniref:DUF1816 domain-containing protein n=1 Tax=Pleurocapsa sp. PCC 7327 TaxID=118163 RepID=UPI00029FCB67|nr:DUF1816 domain-containing protein [Pleurocapsa sp. PCC 7327]AFY78199.1 protein of unknown function (DUF1816) [Pleurocapsa sp. PCC 7327]MBF2019998.1 DUF1816 domain-containing protein [Hydrococcus sp. C42_A2020_068]
MKELLLWILNLLGLAYWIEIVTDYPKCTYYFGPFMSYEEARMAQGGYIEDLQQERAQGIAVIIKRTKPVTLTIFDEQEDMKLSKRVMSFGSSVS